MRTMLRGKIHRATVTDAHVDYEGSISLDPVLMEAADILPYEQVQVLDIDNGARLTTYAIEGQRNTGEVTINGAAARLVSKGDLVIILAYETITEDKAHSIKPHLVYVDANNQIVQAGHNRRQRTDDLLKV
ncbi:aspartate 1-decarboxylase [Dehalococcoidia bacterium]|nr:aspartate 1-decarboxylase [Dehalococcoidia bacterium]